MKAYRKLVLGVTLLIFLSGFLIWEFNFAGRQSLASPQEDWWKEQSDAFYSGDWKIAYEGVLPYALCDNLEGVWSMAILFHHGFGKGVPIESKEEGWDIAKGLYRYLSYKGWDHRPMVQLETIYKWGHAGGPENTELSECWRAAGDWEQSHEPCVALEKKAGLKALAPKDVLPVDQRPWNCWRYR